MKITLDEALKKIKQGKQIELRFNLNGLLFSRHRFLMDDNIIYDFSYVDDSETTYTEKEYRKSFYAERFNLGNVELEEEYTL